MSIETETTARYEGPVAVRLVVDIVLDVDLEVTLVDADEYEVESELLDEALQAAEDILGDVEFPGDLQLFEIEEVSFA